MVMGLYYATLAEHGVVAESLKCESSGPFTL